MSTSSPHRRSQHSMGIVLEFHAEAPQATASEGLAQGPYVAARAGLEPTTLRTKGDESMRHHAQRVHYIDDHTRAVNYHAHAKP